MLGFFYLAPLFITLFVLAIFPVFYATFLSCPSADEKCNLVNLKLIFADISPEVATSAVGYLDRVTWTLAGGLHLIVSLAAIAVSCLIIYHALNRHGVRERLGLICASLAVAANLGLIAAVLTSLDVSSPARLILERTAALAVPRIDFYNRFFEALGVTVGIMLAVAASTLIWRDTREMQDEEELKRRLRLLRALLYAGAAALIIGVLRLAAALNWGGDFWAAGSPAGKEAASLLNGILSSLGISYTLILVSMYLPTVLMLNARAQALAQAKAPEKSKEWLEKNGLTLSYLGYLPRLLALLGPILVGPLGQLLNKLIALATVDK